VKKKRVKKSVYKRRIKACAQSPTLEDVVRAAHAAGATVSVSLVPRQPERPRLDLPSDKWPGDVYSRSTMAALDYTAKDVERVFKENPTSLWIVTPYEIISRKDFFNPKPVEAIPPPAPPAAPASASQPQKQA